MQTTIDNNYRTFLIQKQGFGSQMDTFCNLSDIPNVIKQQYLPNEQFKVYEYLNRKFKGISKKRLNEIFEANKINFKIK